MKLAVDLREDILQAAVTTFGRISTSPILHSQAREAGRQLSHLWHRGELSS